MEEALEDRVARLASRYDSGEGEGAALTREALARLDYRRRHSGKRCDRCREEKPLSAFGRDSRERSGLMRKCRACVATYNADRPSRRVNALDS